MAISENTPPDAPKASAQTKADSKTQAKDTSDTQASSETQANIAQPSDSVSNTFETANKASDIQQIHLDSKKAARRASLKKWGFFLGLLILLIIIAALSATLFYGEKYATEQLANQNSKIKELRTQLNQDIQLRRTDISKNSHTLDQLTSQLSNQKKTLERRLLAAEDRLKSQNKRLLSLSTTTREDWLLAEAEYLLKLANQRVLIEKNVEGADALLEEADNILRDLDDPDLYSLRQAIHKDLAALRLTVKIDQQGIYLSLVALAEQIENLPILPITPTLPFSNNANISTKNISRENITDKNMARENVPSLNKPTDEDSLLTPNTMSVLSTISSHVKSFFSSVQHSLQSYIRITDHDEKPTLIQTPESALYLQQNLRLMLERAQLALMREQQTIYSSSLNQAQVWLEKYYPLNEKRRRYIEQLEIEKNKNISRSLPDITQSLELLHTYIEQLHLLQGAGKPALGEAQ